MYCKDCEYWKTLNGNKKYCKSPKFTDDFYPEIADDMLAYEYSEGGLFFTGQLFGCLHFKKKDEAENEPRK